MIQRALGNAIVAVGLAASAATGAHAMVQTHLSPTAFEAAAGDLTTYTVPEPRSEHLASYTLGSLTFVSGDRLYIVDDGAYGDGVRYIDARSFGGAGIDLFIDAAGSSALSFVFADYDTANPIDIVVDGVTMATVTAGPSRIAAPEPVLGFIGLTSSVPMASIIFRNPLGFEIDITGFQVGSAHVSRAPEPATLASLLIGLVGLGLARRHARAR